MKAAVVESVIDFHMKNADLFVLMDIINLRGLIAGEFVVGNLGGIADGGFFGNNSG